MNDLAILASIYINLIDTNKRVALFRAINLTIAYHEEYKSNQTLGDIFYMNNRIIYRDMRNVLIGKTIDDIDLIPNVIIGACRFLLYNKLQGDL